MSIFDYLKDNKEAIQALSSMVTVIVAFFGFSIWRRQLKGSTQYQIAKEILENLFRVEIGFSYVRNPGIFLGEYPDDLQKKSIMDEADRLKALTYVYQTRMEHLFDEFKKLEDSYLKGIVILGDKYKDSIIPLRKCKAELVVAIQQYLDELQGQYKNDQERNLQIHGIMYEIGITSKHDYLTKHIKLAMKLVIRSIKPFLTNRVRDRIRTIGLKQAIQRFQITFPKETIQ